MDLEGLYSFLVVAREKSISKAAKVLFITQPTLSSRIRRLEEGLGVELIDRNWKGIRLTKEGSYFLLYASKLLQELSDVSTVISSKERDKSTYDAVTNSGGLVIGVDAWLAPIFTKLILDEIKKLAGIEYKIITRPSSMLVELLRLNVIDLALFYSEDTEGEYQDDSFSIEDEGMLLYHATYKLKDDFSNISIINDKPFLLFDNPVLVYHDKDLKHVMKQFADTYAFQIETFQVVDDISVMIHTIAADLGYTLMPKSSVYHLISLFDGKKLPINYKFIGKNQSKTKLKIGYQAAKLSALGVGSSAENLYQSIVKNYK